MPAKELESVKSKLNEQDGRIKSLESTVSAVLPPLLEKFDKSTGEMHKLCLSINSLVSGLEQNSKEMLMFSNRLDKAELNHTILKEEVIENRPLVKVVKGLGIKVFWYAFVLAGSALSIAFAVVMAFKLNG